MPKPDKIASSSKTVEQANASSSVASVMGNDLLNAIESLKAELKKDNDSLKTELRQDNDVLRRNISSLQQELSSKLDNMAEDMRGLTDRVEEAETRVGHVEDMTLELSQEMMECMKRQRELQNKLTDLESRSQRNNM